MKKERLEHCIHELEHLAQQGYLAGEGEAERRAILAWLRGRLRYDQGRYEEALAAYEEAERALPSEGRILREKLAEAFEEVGNKLGWRYEGLRIVDALPSRKAEFAFRMAIALGRSTSSLYYSLGAVQSKLGKHEVSLINCKNALEIDPNNIYAWNGLGNVYYDLGRYEKAMEAYRRAVELDPKYASPWNGLGNVYRRLGRYEKAMEAYRKAIALDPKYASPWNGLGNVYADLGRYEEAMEAYRRAIELDPKYAAPWYNMGIVYRRLGRYEEAMEAYRKAIALDPKFAAPWHGLGLVHTLQGDLEAALDAFRKAVGLAPDKGVYHLALFGTLLRLGREEEARREEEIARPLIEKENAYNRACFAALRGDKEEALRLLKVALNKAPGYRLWARQDPDLESLHDDPRFWDLVSEAPS